MIKKPSANGKKKEMTEAQKSTLIKPGQVLNPKGRPKGSRNVLGQQFIDALQADFQEHGADVIAAVRTDKPDAYLKVIASILPKELNINTNQVNELSDEQLSEFVEAVRLAISIGVPASAGSGAEKAVRH